LATGIALTPLFLIRAARPLTLAFVQYTLCGALAAASSMALETVQPQPSSRRRPRSLFATPAGRSGADPVARKLVRGDCGGRPLGERLTPVGAIGCLLILIGAVAVELAPAFARRSAAQA